MKRILVYLLSIMILTGCSRIINEDELNVKNKDKEESEIKVQQGINEKEVYLTINKGGNTIMERFNVPDGYERIVTSEDSFANYLRNLPLKPHDSKVLYYNGSVKENYGVYEAVVDIDIGTRNLQQCADAIMRLRAEYLFSKGEYEKIHFNFTNGFRVDYNKWIQGYRVAVEGNNAYWVNKNQVSNSYEDFRRYMDLIFAYAGTLSLAKELKPVEVMDMQIGDIFIQGGSPGHAVIVVDMAEKSETGERVYMLAQSYMPAQDIQILTNRNNDSLSPWYILNNEEEIKTPEWTFARNDLKRFAEE